MPRDIYQAPESDLWKEQKEYSSFFDIIRWVALIPAIFISWFILLIVGGVYVLDSGAIDKNNGIPIFWLLGSLSAVTVLFVGFWVAPRRKYLVVKCVYIAGGVISSIILLGTISLGEGGPFLHCSISAIISGGFTFLFLKRKSHITSLKTNASEADSAVAKTRRPF